MGTAPSNEEAGELSGLGSFRRMLGGRLVNVIRPSEFAGGLLPPTETGREEPSLSPRLGFRSLTPRSS